MAGLACPRATGHTAHSGHVSYIYIQKIRKKKIHRKKTVFYAQKKNIVFYAQDLRALELQGTLHIVGTFPMYIRKKTVL